MSLEERGYSNLGYASPDTCLLYRYYVGGYRYCVGGFEFPNECPIGDSLIYVWLILKLFDLSESENDTYLNIEGVRVSI